jgi:glycerophosphoryl diester phosphodiesterase
LVSPDWWASPGPLVFAHRGGGKLAPENTIEAFDRGLALGSDGIELDVHLSRDGQVVVHHDRTLERTTALSGPIGERTADELARAGVPTLAAVLARYPDARLIVELKMDHADLAREAVDLVRRAGAIERVCFGAFGRRVLRAVRDLEPAAATSAAREEVRWALYRSRIGWPVRRGGYGGYQIPEQAGPTRVVSPRFVRHAHQAGLRVQVWTVDDEDDARRLLGWGVDGLITDRPDRIVPVVRSTRGQPRQPWQPWQP